MNIGWFFRFLLTYCCFSCRFLRFSLFMYFSGNPNKQSQYFQNPSPIIAFIVFRFPPTIFIFAENSDTVGVE